MTDAVLFNKWRSERDAEAFRELASRYSGMVYATCLRVLRNPQEAEEAAQECFEKLAVAPRITAPYLGPWLHKVATNRALDRLRHEGCRQAREDRYASERGVEHAPEWDDIYPLVDEAITELPEELRAPLVYHFLEGRTHESIAQELGVPRPTVTYRIQRALERVRQSLKRRGVEVAGAALAALLGEKLAEAAVVPAALEAALGRIAMAGLKAAPAATGGASALFGGLAAKVLLGAVVVAVAAGVAWQVFVPKQPSLPPTQHAEASQPAIAQNPLPSPKAAAIVANPAPVTVAAPPAAVKGGVLTGRVYDAKTRLGVAGMEICADCVEAKTFESVFSGADGVYQISGLAAGTYTVRPGGHVTGYSERGFKSINVTVDPEKPAEGVDFALEPGIPVSGRVVSADGQPVVDAHVGAMVDGQSGAAHAQSRADGSFQIDMPEPGVGLQVQAKSSDFQSVVLRRDTLGQGGTSGMELVLTEPLTASIEGQLQLSDGSPAVDYSLHLDSDGLAYLVGVSDGKSEAGGIFKIDKLAAGTYSVVFGRPGHDGWSTSDEVGQVTVEAGQALKGVLLRMDSGKQGLSISGQVVDTSGKGVAQVTVSSNSNGESASSLTDEQGNFTLSGLKEGPHFLRAATLVRGNPDVTPHSPASVPNVEAGTRGLKIVVERVGRIEGRVVSARDGKPLSSFETYLYQGSSLEFRPQLLGNAQSVNDPEGRFAREQVDTGPQTVVVKAPGYAPSLKVVEVKEDQTTTAQEFRLDPAAALTGSVVDEDGKPITDVGIFADSPGIHMSMEKPLARTGVDGTFSLDLLPSQISRVVAYHPEYPPARADIDQLGNIVLQKGGAVEGRVTLNGQPLEGCQIVSLPPAGGFGSATSKADGSYHLGALPTGTVSVQANAERTRGCVQKVTIEPGVASTLDFDFAAADAAVEGNVTLSGKPVANALIALTVETAAGEESKHAKTDAAGHYVFGGVPPGLGRLVFLGAMNEQQNALNEQHYAMRRAQLEVEPGATVQQDFEISAPGAITGKVTGNSNEWTTMVLLMPSDAVVPSDLDADAFQALMFRHAMGTAMAEADGTYEIKQVPAGDYVVLAILVPKSDPGAFADVQMDSAPVHVGDGPVTVNLALP